MRLVDYSSSEDDEPEEQGAISNHKAGSLPELPPGFHDLYSGATNGYEANSQSNHV